MKIGPALISFGILTALYIGGLVYIDRQSHVFASGIDLATTLPQVALFALTSFVLRYARWRWLLTRRGFRTPWGAGLLAYFSGFALTASPGKVGELVRIRYFAAMGVPADQVFACFVFERMLDLIVVLILALPLFGTAGGLGTAFAFVAIIAIAVAILSRITARWMRLAQWFQSVHWQRMAELTLSIGEGFKGAASYFKPVEFIVALTLGLAAWAIQSLGCVYLLGRLGINLPPFSAFAIYPLALLIGAASMLPGGIGTTEAAIVFLLHGFGASLDRAMLSAIGMRLSTLWFAIVLGLIAIPFLEFQIRKALPQRSVSRESEPAISNDT